MKKLVIEFTPFIIILGNQWHRETEKITIFNLEISALGESDCVYTEIIVLGFRMAIIFDYLITRWFKQK